MAAKTLLDLSMEGKDVDALDGTELMLVEQYDEETDTYISSTSLLSLLKTWIINGLLSASTATTTYLSIANSRYQFVSDAGTTYTVPASAVTANGNTIIELSNNSLTDITINTATATGKTAGDSVTISITGTYAAQILDADGVTLNGTLAFSDNAKIKTLIYRGSDTWTVLGG